MNTPSEARMTVQVLCGCAAESWFCMTLSGSVAPPTGGLIYTDAAEPGIWTGSDSRSSSGADEGRSARVQRLQPPFELGALDVVRAQLDRPLIGARGAVAPSGAPEQLGVRRMQRLVVLEGRIAEQRLEQLEARRGARGAADGGGAIELDHR